MPPEPLTISMLCMLIVLSTITHNHSCTMKPTWIMCPDHRLLAMLLQNRSMDVSGYRPWYPDPRNIPTPLFSNRKNLNCYFIDKENYVAEEQPQ